MAESDLNRRDVKWEDENLKLSCCQTGTRAEKPRNNLLPEQIMALKVFVL
jgi:hypothetical protein